MSLANTLYGLNLSPDNFEEMGVVAWSKIGNKRTRLYRITLDVSCKNTVDLPCNCDIIEAITYGFEDWNWVTNLTNNGDWSTNFTEHYIEARKMFENPLYVSGKYVKYERVGNTLYLDNNYGGKINLLYKGEVLDDDGLPQITDKEAEAIAAFCAYAVKYKEGLQTNNANIINLANDLKETGVLYVMQQEYLKNYLKMKWMKSQMLNLVGIEKSLVSLINLLNNDCKNTM